MARRRLMVEAAAEERGRRATGAAEAAGAAEAEEARRQAEVAASFRHLTEAEEIEAATRLLLKMPGRVSFSQARGMIVQAENDRRSLFELRNQVRVPNPRTGASALDDPDLVQAMQQGNFSFRRAEAIQRQGRLGLRR